MYTDETLNCVDCNAAFTFSAGEQEFFASKGFTNKPNRCPDCRSARKAQRAGGGGSSYSGGGGGGGFGGAAGGARPQREMLPVRRRGPSAVPTARRQARVLPRLLRFAPVLSLSSSRAEHNRPVSPEAGLVIFEAPRAPVFTPAVRRFHQQPPADRPERAGLRRQRPGAPEQARVGCAG
jgi:hypothetical protein